MKLYNALSRSIEEFTPHQNTVTVYVCGITPYDTTHLGHAFTYTVFDVLIRYLEYKGHGVRYVQNVTDIDDDILRKAAEVGKDWQTLGNQWTAHFINDMQALNVRPPDHFPRATGVIAEIIEMVQCLIGTGVAYEANGSVYFQVEAWSDYGQLSRLPRDEMLAVANERGNRPDDPNKRHPLDFVLWQAQAPGEPAWDSPWGPGRPGWHIECTTMSTSLLGDTIDVHGGGGDLLFPHHESEIAQAECATATKPFVRFWMHAAMVYHEGEKMSKSLGNLVMIRDLIKTWSPNGLRLYLAGHHYRDIWSHDDETLAQAEALAHKIEAAMNVIGRDDAPFDPTLARTEFEAALDNDLDTPAALAALDIFAGAIVQAGLAGRAIEPAQAVLRTMGQVFGLYFGTEPEARVTVGWNEHLKRFE
jgi:L-cysteine:1D-myo-inositol 2-amino-2-deoxy-alpha-D-glucopyranoside ligase